MRIAVEKPCGLEEREEHQPIEHKRAIQVALSLCYISLDMGQEGCTLYFETLIELFGLLQTIKGYRYPSFSTYQYLFNLFCYADITGKSLLCRECAFVSRL